jgi:predicted nucleotidyltransferase component of viral defense system
LIDRGEILAVATDLGLAPEIVEKDYVLGWLLKGIYSHPALSPAWTFKGGTCLKKCYFETYRFSEDLDFTLSDAAHLDAEFLVRTFSEVGEKLYEDVGLQITAEQPRFDIYGNSRGGLSCEGRLYYEGPLMRTRSTPRIKLDLTVDELLVLPAVDRPVGHPYSDAPADGISARCYAYEEVFGEKVRALAERTRPRDLYDVVNLFRHDEFRPDAVTVLGILQKKCAFKGIDVPTFETIGGAMNELVADWANMLGHQLPKLPPFESFWSVMPAFFSWLASGITAAPAPAAPLASDEQVFRPAVGLLRRAGAVGSSSLEAIRFAAANRLCVDLHYLGSVRRIEPYSLRRTRAGAILLFGIRTDNGESRSYRLDRVEGATITDEIFRPQFAIELTPGDSLWIPPIARPPRRGRTGRR